MAEQPIEIPVKLSIGDTRKEIKRLKNELANTFDPDLIAQYSAQIGELQDNLIRVNEQAAIYAAGSPFEQSANALSLMNGQLASLDFEGAAESALLLQERIAAITPEQITKQMQGLQQMFGTLGKISGQVIIGMIKNVGAMAKAFMAFGAQLLANPIFIFAIVIAAIVAAIALLLNKLGLLKPILDAIGAVFGWIGDVIDAVVQAIKDFLDWLGLTDYAAEDSARRQTEAAEKKADAYEKASKNITAALDHEIKMNQINGKSTVALEIEKQRVIRQTAKLRLEALQAKYRENKLTNEMDAEEIKALHEKIAAQRELIRNSNYEIVEIRAKDAADQKKKREEDAKEQKAEADKNAKESAERAKKYKADRLAAERQYRDVELSLMAEGVEKEVALNTEKYKRIIEDTKRNENLLAAEKKQLIEGYEAQRKADEDKIREEDFKRRQDESKAEAAEMEEAMAQMKAGHAAYLEAQIKAELEKTERIAELAHMRNENDLDATLKLLDAQKALELANKELTEEEKALIEEKYRQQREEAEKAAADRRKEIERQVTDATATGIEAIGSLSDFVFSVRERNLKDGSAAEQKAAKKNFEINKKVQIAQAVIQGYQATLAAYASGVAIPVVGPVMGPLFALGAAAVALKNVNEIRSKTFEGGGGSGGGATGGGSAPSAPGTGSNAPTFNLTGSGTGQGNNAQSNGPVEQTLNVTLENKISETEITQTQQKVVKYENSATLTNG